MEGDENLDLVAYNNLLTLWHKQSSSFLALVMLTSLIVTSLRCSHMVLVSPFLMCLFVGVLSSEHGDVFGAYDYS